MIEKLECICNIVNVLFFASFLNVIIVNTVFRVSSACSIYYTWSFAEFLFNISIFIVAILVFPGLILNCICLVVTFLKED